MLFNSLTYIAFMLLAAPLTIFGPAMVRKLVLLAGSLMFYAFWRVDFTLLVVFSGVVDYVCSLRIDATESTRVKKSWLMVSLVVNLGLLVFFKYTYFIVGTTQSIFEVLGMSMQVELPRILLPLGISFYTFQTISYTIDVYRGVQKPVRDLPLFLTYVMFWPQLVAGPVLRASEVIPQLEVYARPGFEDVVAGVEDVIAGLFKKAVLADTIAGIVDYGFAQPVHGLGMLDVWTLAFAFGLQIYFDFSGYSQIAIGSARLMGFKFPRNFDWPYMAVNPREFWKRWHISLSAWIRDYLYLPLTGSKFRTASTGGIDVKQGPTTARKDAALFATWFIMGLWHGANWTFAVWGLWHALLIWLYRVSEPVRVRLPRFVRSSLGWMVTLGLCMLGWLFFRSQSVGDAVSMLGRAFDVTALGRMSMRENHYLITGIFFAGLLVVASFGAANRKLRVPAIAQVGAMAMAHGVMLFALFLMLRPVKQFIYFQF